MNYEDRVSRFEDAYEEAIDALIQGQMGENRYVPPSKYPTLEESWEEADRYYASLNEQPARKAIAQVAPITNRLMQSKSDMEAFAALSPEQKQVIIQFAKQNGIAKYVGSDNVSMVRQAWRNRGK